jgi:hypothetical protein
MIYLSCDCRLRLLPSFHRYFVQDTEGRETEHRMWNATWLTFMVAHTSKDLSERMISLLRKSAKEVVTLDNLKGKIAAAVERRVNRRMSDYDAQRLYDRKENSDLRAQNNKLYQENCEMRSAIRTFNKVVQL